MNEAQRLKLLKVVFYADAFVLMLIGLMLMFATNLMFDLFKLQQLSPETGYIVGMWGALMSTMGFGYFLAALHPERNNSWLLVGIFRAIFEVAVSVYCVISCAVKAETAWLGIALAAWFAIAYIVLYPYKGNARRFPDDEEAVNE